MVIYTWIGLSGQHISVYFLLRNSSFFFILLSIILATKMDPKENRRKMDDGDTASLEKGINILLLDSPFGPKIFFLKIIF